MYKAIPKYDKAATEKALAEMPECTKLAVSLPSTAKKMTIGRLVLGVPLVVASLTIISLGANAVSLPSTALHYQEKSLEQIQALVTKVNKEITLLSAKDKQAFRVWVKGGLK